MQADLRTLFFKLRELIDQQSLGDECLAIRDIACTELCLAINKDYWPKINSQFAIKQPFLDVMTSKDANNICKLILQMPFDWIPPKSSDDPDYTALSDTKALVELLGPDGLIKSEKIRLGLYGILPNTEYGTRIHPAEEIFIMLAGQAEWLCGSHFYEIRNSGEYSYHPSSVPHATRTGHKAFMSLYIWSGDVSIDGYRYFGVQN